MYYNPLKHNKCIFTPVLTLRNRSGYCSGNALDLYAGGVRFDSRRRQAILTHGFGDFSVPPGKYLENTTFMSRRLPSKYFPI